MDFSFDETTIRKRLIGVWKLLTFEVAVEGETLYPFGEYAIGRLEYDASGRMSAQLMKLGRESSVTDPNAVSGLSEDELRQIADGYIGYYGTFEIDGNTLIHHVEACNLPAWSGTDQRREWEFMASQLVLRVGSSKLVWERLPD